MDLPVYTELSNFSVRKSGKKVTTDLSIVLIINRESDPVDSINSIYNFISKTKYKTEFLLINRDKEGYKYDKLLSTFQIMRVLLPQDKISLVSAINLVVTESLSKHILFTNEFSQIQSVDDEIIDMYLSESTYGAIIPLMLNPRDEVIPNIVKGGASRGFINTISRDIVGSAVSSIYPKYFCFILNKDAIISREINLNEYRDEQYVLLDLGYQLWKEGFVILQVRNFKMVYQNEPKNDIMQNYQSEDYLAFNFNNLTSDNTLKERNKKIIRIILGFIFTFRFKNLIALFRLLKESKNTAQKNSLKPVEDSAIFSIINKDLK